jgi:predicted amino acid dehydrogenase
MGRLPRFAFLVHPLASLHQRALGLRQARPGLVFGWRDGTSPYDIGHVARVGLRGIAEGVVISVSLTPEQLMADQSRALARMERAVRTLQAEEPVDVVGLGSLCAVVAGRGEALAERVDVPVTTGGAATAWALLENTRAVQRVRGGPVAVVGARSPVGRAVAALLSADGVDVHVDSRRAARGLNVTAFASPEEAVAGCSVVAGAGPTGGTVAPEAFAAGAVLVDVAIPPTPTGPVPRGVRVLAGEAVSVPRSWTRGGWGRIYQVLAGYGPWQAYACLIEPLVMAAQGRKVAYALGRRLDPDDVARFGEAATAYGFKPRLARGWVKARRLG